MRRAWSVLAMIFSLTISVAARSQGDASPEPFTFAVMGSAGKANDRDASATLQAIAQGTSRFVVHFDLANAASRPCSDAMLEARRRLLDASARPAVPVVAAVEWADCGDAKDAGDPADRLARVGDLLFGGDESPGQARLRWSRQSAMPRYGRYRENLRWQEGRVLFVTFNLPDNNNNYRFGAGRNGEFDDRLIANRAWLERAFRIATERRLAGIVLFFDAAPRFGQPMHTPDPSSRDRDGYHEWKLALREHVAGYKGQVLLVQGRSTARTPREPDHPLRDANGKPFAHLTRIALPESTSQDRWIRVDVDPGSPTVFGLARQRVFDDPSGELYGTGRTR